MSTPLTAPFPWFGGKRRVANLVWERFGADVPNYVEPFAGSLAVMLARPAEPRIETVNDKDCHLANFWRATQHDPERVAHFADWPVNEADLHARHRWLVTTGADRVARLRTDPDYYDAQVAGWWVWGLCQWIGGGWCRGTPHRFNDSRPDLHSAGHGVFALHQKRPDMRRGGKGVHHTRPEVSVEERRPVLSHGANGVHLPLRQPDVFRGNGRGVIGASLWQQTPDLKSGRGVHRDRSSGDVAEDVGGQMPTLQGRRDVGGTTAGTCAERSAQLVALFERLRDRLRRVRVCCGDWSRILGPTPTHLVGTTAVLLDPPYSHDVRDKEIYGIDEDMGTAVRDWAVANGDHPRMRIALCGYAGEHDMPATWSVVRWKAHGGYGAQSKRGRGAANAHRETIWFSPHCLDPRVRQHRLDFGETAS